jgi:hypothetical protein
VRAVLDGEARGRGAKLLLEKETLVEEDLAPFRVSAEPAFGVIG